MYFLNAFEETYNMLMILEECKGNYKTAEIMFVSENIFVKEF